MEYRRMEIISQSSLACCRLSILFLILWGDVAGAQLDAEVSYLFDVYNVHGTRRDGSSGIGSLVVSAEYSLTENHALGGSFNLIHSSGSPSDRVGDIQVLSNIDAQGQETTKLYELYWQSRWGPVSLQLGFIDLSRYFNLTESSLDLIHSSFGTSPEWGNTGFYGPSIYPIPSFGLLFIGALGPGLNVKSALFDPISRENFQSRSVQSDLSLSENRNMAIVEISQRLGSYSFNVGGWNFVELSERLPRFHQNGVYFDIEKTEGQIRPFAKLGYSSSLVNRVFSSVVVGTKVDKIFQSKDSISFGVIQANIGAESRSEKVYEFLYHTEITREFSVSGSLQRIENSLLSGQDANIFIFRIELQKILQK